MPNYLGLFKSVGKLFQGARPIASKVGGGLREFGGGMRGGLTPGTRAGRVADTVFNGGGLTGAYSSAYLAGWGGLVLGAPVVTGVYDAVTGQREKRLLEEIEREQRYANLEMGERVRLERLKQGMIENIQRLAEQAPDIYNRLITGRATLPQGARVFGGRLRTDLLEEAAMHMAMGTTPSYPDLDGPVSAGYRREQYQTYNRRQTPTGDVSTLTFTSRPVREQDQGDEVSALLGE